MQEGAQRGQPVCRLVELEAVRRPPWALGIGRDGDGLFLELADRRLY